MKRIFGLAVAILMAISIADCDKKLDKKTTRSITKDWFKALAAVDPNCKQQRQELLQQTVKNYKATVEQYVAARKQFSEEMAVWRKKFKQKFCVGKKEEGKKKKKKK